MATPIPDLLTLEVMSHEPGVVRMQRGPAYHDRYWHAACAAQSTLVPQWLGREGVVVEHLPGVPGTTECIRCNGPLRERPRF